MNIGAKKLKDLSANIISTKPRNPSAEISPTRPKNPSANLMPTTGYVLEIDGKFKSEYASSEQALSAGRVLKTKFPKIQVNIYGAKEQTRTAVTLPQ